MNLVANIDIMPHQELLDPQGKTVLNSLSKLGFSNIEKIRIGKKIDIEFECNSLEEGKKQIVEICDKMLVNKIMEQYSFNIKEVER